jgi:drug/metabolite transporter (DMT)-like permease
MKETLSKWPGHLAVLAVNVFFGFNSPMAKLIVPEAIPPGAFTLVRMCFATLVFWTISAFCPKEHVTKRDLLTIFLGGLFGLVAVQYSFAEALRYTSPINITLIAALAPIVVMLLAAVVLKEPITWMKAGGVAVGVSGILLLILPQVHAADFASSLKGDLLCFVNITSYAIYLILTRQVTQRYTVLTLMKWMFLFSALCTLPMGAPELMHARIFSAESTWRDVLCLAYICIFATSLAYFLIPLGLKRLRPTTVSMYSNLQPIITSCIAIYLGQDRFSWDMLLAALMVMGGVIMVTQSKSRRDLKQGRAARPRQ